MTSPSAITPAEGEPRPCIPSDQEPLPSGLIPAERLALTVARAQVERGESPTPNIAAVLVMALDRLTGGPARCIEIDGPRTYALTRDGLVTALTRTRLKPGTILAEWMADAILEVLDDLSDEREAAP